MAKGKSQNSNIEKGFSLLELLMVVAILGLVAGVTAARLSGPSEKTILTTESRKLISHLRTIRSKALAETRFHSMEMLENGEGYSISPGGETVLLPQPVKLSLSRTASAEDNFLSAPSIVFYPDGRTTGGSISLEANDYQQTIVVNWITGEVALESPGSVENASGS